MSQIPFSSQFAQEIRRFYGPQSAKASSYVQRIESLIRTFQDEFPGPNRLSVVRAPGRVNLIGEHTDYNGYPVLPIAIERDIVAAVAPNEGPVVQVFNADSRYGKRDFEVSRSIPPFGQGDWGNYVKAAVQGIVEAGLVPLSGAKGMRAVFSGTIPPAAGLSSSSALVVASALAFLSAHEIEANKSALAELLPRAERYVGTESGGMDQAIALLGEQGKALRIDFYPLRIDPIPVPEGYTFVICNSLVDASKSGVARSGYNLRVVECRLAAALLAYKLSQETGRRFKTTLLSDLAPQRVGMNAQAVDALARTAMGDSPLTLSAIAERLGCREETVIRDYCTLRDGSAIPIPEQGFKVWQRYRHVTGEARRVMSAVEALREKNLSLFGELMNESHESCRNDYEVSCPELDELVESARRFGALGARLTGAGFGGCTVNLVKESGVTEFIQRLKREYYGRHGARVPEHSQFDDIIFSCHPSKGAGTVGQKLELV